MSLPASSLDQSIAGLLWTHTGMSSDSIFESSDSSAYSGSTADSW